MRVGTIVHHHFNLKWVRVLGAGCTSCPFPQESFEGVLPRVHFTRLFAFFDLSRI